MHLQSTLIGFIVAALVLWRVGTRVWRLTTRQPIRLWSLRLRAVLLTVVVIILAFLNIGHTLAFAALVAGTLAGIFAGYVGLRGSTFENTPDGLFYTPHRGLGGAIALIFVARIVYRIVVWQTSARDPGASDMYGLGTASHMGASPITVALFGLLAGYIVMYTIGVLRWREKAMVRTVDGPAVEGPDGVL